MAFISVSIENSQNRGRGIVGNGKKILVKKIYFALPLLLFTDNLLLLLWFTWGLIKKNVLKIIKENYLKITTRSEEIGKNKLPKLPKTGR